VKRSSLHSFLVALAALLLGAPLAAQEPVPADTGWNAGRALELMHRAQERRSAANADTGLVNYEADARLYVYFYLDRTDTGERNLVKTDQLALDVLWQAPDHVKQRIIGWRDEKSLPTNIHYHLDHLTVVQENFGDEIRIGDGDEVRGVVHPAAGGSEGFYDFRLADSLTLRLPGVEEPVRVYEIRVRPKDVSKPAFVGSVFVDRRAGDLVRMDFTFTRAAYRDRSLDYINISLDNGLWRGRFWLPNEQRVEIRRRVPELDFPVGSVIRGSIRVTNYRFNQPLPPQTFAGPRVVALPRAQRESFPFEEGIHAEVREEGIGPSVELEEVRKLAAELVKREAIRKVTGLRVSIPRASDVFRYDRAEGVVLGAGASITPTPGVTADLRGGWAFRAEHPVASVTLRGAAGGMPLSLAGYLNRPGDVGVGPVTTGSMNTLSSLFAGTDFTDPYYTSGVALRATRALTPGWALAGEVRGERQRSARQETDFSFAGDHFRPVREIDEGTQVGARVELSRRAPAEVSRWWSTRLRLTAGVLDSGGLCIPEAADCMAANSADYLKPEAELGWGYRWSARESELALGARAGAALGDLSRQALYLIGGHGTVPGYGFRAFGGDRYLVANATLSGNLVGPWVRGRLLAAVGATGVGEAGRSALERWPAATSGGLKPSVGVGLGLVHDILRVDLARGLASDGRWEVVVEANPSFWDFL
jgi:hypothetical protein